MEAANARVLAFGASVGVINAISNAFKGLVTSTIEVEKSLTEIKIIGNETFKDLNATSAGLFATAKQLGVSYKDASDATLEFARQGKGLTESLNASKAALALTRTAGISATEAVMGLTSAVNAFGRGADAYIEYANKMSAVSDSFAVNNKDLIEGMSRSASVAQEAGVSFEELTALITTLQEKTGRGGAVIGNALKTIFTRVQNPEIIKDLRDLGIAVQDTSTGSFLSATQIIQNLANEFQGFDKNLRNSVLLKVGGGFQVDKLAAVLNDVKDAGGTFQQSLNIAMSGSGNILGRVAELNKTIDSSFTNILTASKQLGSNIGQVAFSKDFANILQNGASLIGSLNEAIFGTGGKDAEDQGSTIGKALLKGIGSVISGPGLALFVGILGKLSLDFAKFSTTGIQTLLGITSKTKEEQLIQAAISKTLSENTRFQKQIYDLEGNRVAQAELLLSVIRQQVNESKKLEGITKDASSILYQRGVRLSGASPEIKNSAEGYIPNLSSAILKEKSESPAGSRIIVDRNFPMGGGERGTMVYNSNETRIKNFGGSGGDAIIPNYPINSAAGYTPNFAKRTPRKPPTDPEKILTIDGEKASVAGLTFAGETQGIMKKTKSISLDEKLLGKYKGSPILEDLKQFERFNIVNLPVGSVYRFRKGLKGDEDTLKKDFVAKLNSQFRDKFIEVITNEITGIGLQNGGGVGENLKNLKLNIFTPSSAGYIFEEILKIPTLTNAEKVAQYAAQSETEFFDMQNLEPNFAKEYGLPAKKHRYVELKLGEGELYDGISKKFLNQLILEGGGADPGKFGVRSKRAASGYIPNFAKNISTLRDEMSKKQQKGSYWLKKYYDVGDSEVDGKTINDKFNGNVKIKYFTLDRQLQEYDDLSKKLINRVRREKNTKSIEPLKDYLSPGWFSTIFNEGRDATSATENAIKGALGERDFHKKFNDYEREQNVLAGIDFYKKSNSGYEMIEIKTRDLAFTKNEANAKVLAFLGSKSLFKNKTEDIIDLTSQDFSLHETWKSPNRKKYKNAANGYIPNFSELTGTGAGMLYSDPNYNELGGGQSGKFLAPKSGEGFGQKIFYKLGNEKIEQEYNVNKAIKEFEASNASLFKENAISFTKVGKLLTRNGLTAGFEREVLGGSTIDDYTFEKYPFVGEPTQKGNFAFSLSENLAQAGVKNVIDEFRKKYGQDSLSIYDIYAQNFKVNELMQKAVIDKTEEVFKKNKFKNNTAVDQFLKTLDLNALNRQFGSQGALHTMFDTMGIFRGATNASKGFIPSFADLSISQGPKDAFGDSSLVAKLGKEQVGSLYYGKSGKSVDISGIEVDEVHRGKGYSKALYQKLHSILGKGTKVTGTLLPQGFDEITGKSTLSKEDQAKLKNINSIDGLKLIYPQLSRISSSRDGAFEISFGARKKITEKTDKSDPLYKKFIEAAKNDAFMEIGLTTFASKGYVPNFSKDAIGQAFAREKVQSGLPDSQISLTQDSRLANNLNPSGFAVINKRDEPNGKVPANRISTAYKNAFDGFIPNFVNPPNTLGSLSSTLAERGIAPSAGLAEAAARKNAEDAKTRSDAEKTVAEKLKSFAKILDEEIETHVTNKTNLSELQPILKKFREKIKEYANLDPKEKQALQRDIITEASASGSSRFTSRNALEAAFSQTEVKFNQQTKDAAERAAAAAAAAASIATTTPSPSNTQQNNQQQASQKAQQQAQEKSTKSFGELAQTAFIFQSGLSFATGALSTFGKEAEALGDVLNSIGQIGYTVIQGNDLFKQITKGRGIGELISSVKRGGQIGAAGTTSRSSELLGRLRGAFVGTAAVEGGAAATGLGAGSAGAATMAAGAIAAGIAAGGYLIYKSIDSIGKFLSGSATRTERAINAFNDIQEKYNIQLSEKQKVTVDRLSELANVSGTSLSGAAERSGNTLEQIFRDIKAFFGFRNETYKNTIQQQIAGSSLNLDAEGNQSLAKLFGPLLAPIMTESTNKKGENGLIITALQSEQDKALANLFSEKLKQIDEIVKEELKKPEFFSKEEIEKIIKDKGLKEMPSQRAATAEELANMSVTARIGYSQTGFISEIKTPEDQAKEELRKRRISDATQVAAARVAERTAPESIAAQAQLEAQKQAILVQTELLKKRLEITQQIAKIESTIPSALESSLSIQKELLSTNEATKFSLELQLKNLQEERQTRAELKDLISTEARDIISKNLEKTASLGVAAPKAQQITGLFNNLQSAQTVEDQKKAYAEIVNQLDLSVSRQMERIESIKYENELLIKQVEENEYLKDFNEEIINSNNKQIEQLSVIYAQLQQRNQSLQLSLDLINKQSEARKIQAAQAAQERAITEKTNYYYTLQKEIFSAQIEIQNKKLEKAKQELDLRKQMRDLAFEESQIQDRKKSEPRKQFEAGMFASRNAEADANEELRLRNADKMQAYRQSLYNQISTRTNDLDILDQASKSAVSGDTKNLENLLAKAFEQQGESFDQKVITAAQQFSDIVVKSAIDAEAIRKGEKSATAYQPISISTKSLDEIMRGTYSDYKSKGEITKDIERLRSEKAGILDEGDGSEEIKKIDEKIKELQTILKETSLLAMGATTGSIKPVLEDSIENAKIQAKKRSNAQTRLTQAESERTTFTGGLQVSKREIDLQIEEFNSRLGKDIPMAFRDSMVSAMRELSNPNSTQPLKDRLLGVANAFLQKINEAFMTQAANKITSGIMGVMPGMASGGYIKGGSGSKDDVPAMLMGGEYVVKKDAVKKYGPSFFDALNNGSIKKFASGGWVESDITKYQDPASVNPYGQRRDQGLSFNENGQVVGMDSYTGTAENKQDAMMRAQTNYYAQNAQTGEGGFYMPGEGGMGSIMGQRNLLAFATQQTAGTRFDKISGAGGAASVDLGAGSSNMSLFALRDQENSRNAAYLESKQKSLDLYLGGIDAAKEKANREEEIRKEQERIKEEFKKQQKAMVKGILINLVGSLAMAGIGKLGSAASKGWNAVNQASGGTAAFGEKLQGAFTGGTMGGETRGGMFNAFSSSGYQDFSKIVDTQGNAYQWNSANKNYSWTDYNSAFPKGASYSSSPNFKWGNQMMYAPTMRRAAGGYVAGNGMGDNVPAMLNGGEFVVSKQAAQNIGVNKLQQINSGNTTDSSEVIAAKLDELVEKLSAVGTLNITVNSDSSGRQENQEQGGNQDRQAKDLARRIKEVVMVVLKDEKRLGGMLR
jgi:TP901 family phage tail tape measure protein